MVVSICESFSSRASCPRASRPRASRPRGTLAGEVCNTLDVLDQGFLPFNLPSTMGTSERLGLVMGLHVNLHIMVGSNCLLTLLTAIDSLLYMGLHVSLIHAGGSENFLTNVALHLALLM